MDVETPEVRAVEIKASHIGEALVPLTCSNNSRCMSRSAASPLTVPATPASAKMPSLTAAPTLSYPLGSAR